MAALCPKDAVTLGDTNALLCHKNKLQRVSVTVLAKLEWFRRGGETSERQWWDIVGVLKVARAADRAHLQKWADALGVTDLLERALAQVDDPRDS